MGCLNNKVQTDKLPTNSLHPIQEVTPRERQQQELPKAVAFQIPNNEIKIKKGKAARPNKQLYIIREVSNINHQLIESPLKQPPQQPPSPVEEVQYQPVQIHTRKRIKTSKELSTGSDGNQRSVQNKTVNFIPDDETPDRIHHQLPIGRIKERALEIRSRKSDSRSQLSNRYKEDDVEEVQGPLKKKRKGSLNLDGSSQHTLHSIHYKRAKTFHADDQLVHPTKSLSINKGTNDVPSITPVFVQPVLCSTDFQGQINSLSKNETQENPKLLQLYHGLSQEQERKGGLQQALTANGKYLRLARRLHGVDSCNYAAGLSNLSSIHYTLQNYEKAIENSMKAKSIRSYAAIDSHMHKARVLNEIGLIQLQQNHLKEATHYLEEVKEIHAKVAKEFQLNLQEITAQCGKDTSNDKYYDRSVLSMEVALKICLRVFGQNHLQTANHLDDLGTGCCDAGRYSESLECFERCFSIIRRMRLSKHKDYQAHTKHFFYNLEVIKRSPASNPDTHVQAIKILQAYFPTHELIGQLKEKSAAVSK